MARKKKRNKFGWRPVLFVPQEKTLPSTPIVFPAFWKIAQRGYDLLPLGSTATEVVRNYAALQFISDERYSHIIMLDSDHVHPENIVEAFEELVGRDPDRYQIIAGLNFKRTEPYSPCVFRQGERILEPIPMNEIQINKLIEVETTGTGSICIDRRVFETIKPPWFIKRYDQWYTDDAITGEDLMFCQKARKYGYKIWAHTSLISPHCTSRFVGPKLHMSFMKHGPAVGDSPLNC